MVVCVCVCEHVWNVSIMQSCEAKSCPYSRFRSLRFQNIYMLPNHTAALAHRHKIRVLEIFNVFLWMNRISYTITTYIYSITSIKPEEYCQRNVIGYLNINEKNFAGQREQHLLACKLQWSVFVFIWTMNRTVFNVKSIAIVMKPFQS